MSQQTQKTGSTSGSKTAKTLLCKTFTESQISQYIDPQWLFLQLQSSGLQYQPQTFQGLQARSIIIEDIKIYIANYFKQNNIDIETDENVAKTINTWFESALIKTNPYVAQASGAISKERMQELMNVVGFGFSPFGQMGGMGMMGGMGSPFGMPGMNPMMGGMGGFQQQMPSWKKDNSQQTQQQQGFCNPIMGGMGMMGGMNPMMPGMGMNPIMGGMGMNPIMGGFQQTPGI